MGRLRATEEKGPAGPGEENLHARLLVRPPPDLRIEAASTSAAPMLGWAHRGLHGARLSDLFGRESRGSIQTAAATAVATGRARTRIHRGGEGAAGRDIHVEIHALGDGAGGGVRWLEVELREMDAAEDPATELMRLRTECEELREEFQQFAYAASHDLAEPLRMITSYLQLLEKRYTGQLDEDADEFIRFATDGARRLRGMIDGLLAFSRVATQAGPIRTVHSAAALTRARNLLAREIDASGARITHGPLPIVRADQQQLTLLFRLLIANSIEYRTDRPPRIHIQADTQDGMCIFSVQDNGIGIDPQHQETIFRAFERLNPRNEHPGVGMGLAIARRIVTRHAGRIWVQSEPGAGAAFRFTLPTADQED